MAKTWRKFRGIDDQTLGAALTNHAQVLGGIAKATELLLRERRLFNLWRAVVTIGVIYALLFSHTPDTILEWFR